MGAAPKTAGDIIVLLFRSALGFFALSYLIITDLNIILLVKYISSLYLNVS